ncbi:MAG: MarR family transcriptional regulator [Erysipelotrichaceae bacterium]|nr:MarR family transcriptional regulator [Erysipelotrichaceae bacterium]
MKECKKRLGPLIKKIHWAVDTRFNELLKSYDLTLSQADLLRYLSMNHDKNIMITQREIEKYFNSSNPTISGLLNRLEEKGFIIRKIDADDARKRKIQLTEKALKIDRELRCQLDTFDDALLSNFDEQQQEQLFSMLEQIVDQLMDHEREM